MVILTIITIPIEAEENEELKAHHLFDGKCSRNSIRRCSSSSGGDIREKGWKKENRGKKFWPRGKCWVCGSVILLRALLPRLLQQGRVTAVLRRQGESSKETEDEGGRRSKSSGSSCSSRRG